MNLSFFPKFFSRYVQSSSSFAKTFLLPREACKYIDKVNYFAMHIKEKTIFVSVAFLMALSIRYIYKIVIMYFLNLISQE